MIDRCAFWISSEQYFDEATRSMNQFRQKMSDIPTHLVYIGSGMPPGKIWFDTYAIENLTNEPWYLQSVHAMGIANRTLHSNLLYFDTDTYLVEPVYELFYMLDNGFDFIAAHAPGRHTAPTVDPIPDAFPEFNIGVCGFADSPMMLSAMILWEERYATYTDIYGNNDQASLREIIWRQSGRVRFATLPPEYNFRFNFGGFLRYPVKVLHGRHPDLARVANSVNKEKGMRLWKPSDMD